MILTPPIPLLDPAGPTPWSAPVPQFFRRSCPLFSAISFPPPGPATGSSNGFHFKSNFLAVHYG